MASPPGERRSSTERRARNRRVPSVRVRASIGTAPVISARHFRSRAPGKEGTGERSETRGGTKTEGGVQARSAIVFGEACEAAGVVGLAARAQATQARSRGALPASRLVAEAPSMRRSPHCAGQLARRRLSFVMGSRGWSHRARNATALGLTFVLAPTLAHALRPRTLISWETTCACWSGIGRSRFLG